MGSAPKHSAAAEVKYNHGLVEKHLCVIELQASPAVFFRGLPFLRQRTIDGLWLV